MTIDLETLSLGTHLLTADEEVAFEDVDGGKNRIACHIELTVRKTPEAVYAHGEVRGVFRTPCHKCLEPTECSVEPSFDVVIKKVSPGAQAPPVGTDEDLIYLSAEDREFSLEQQIYENLVASIPIRIVCSEDCRGLCPGCGVNLNVESCRCAEDVDPRWGALPKPGDTRAE